MKGWKIKLKVTGGGKVLTSSTISIRKSFLQGSNYSPVGFFITEVPVSILIEKTDGYAVGQKMKKSKKTHSLFIDDLKIYQENHQKLEAVNEMIMKASMKMQMKCNTEPRKTSSIFALQGQMIETREWKKIRGLVENDK